MADETYWSAVSDAAHRDWVDSERESKIELLEAEVARLRAELQNAAKAALDATALACEKEREADALRADVERYRYIRLRTSADAADLVQDWSETELDSEIDAAMGEGK